MITYNNAPVHTYIIKGKPIAWARPKLSGKTFYDAQKPIKNNWAISLDSQRDNQPFYQSTPLHLIVNFYFEPPQSYKPAKREALVGKPFIFKGDIDNLCKWVLDNCNAILFDDDCTVFRLTACKTYALEPSTEFALIPLNVEDKPRGR